MLETVHWLGHAAFRLTGEKVIYIDPWQLGEAEPADIILITHDHHDHCSPEDVARIRGPHTAVVAPPSCARKLGGDVRVVKPGEQLVVQGVPIETVSAYNINKSFHRRQEGGVGYVVTLGGQRIYHAGDTDDTPELEAVRADVALLPVGGKYTMTAAEAAAAANAMQPGVAVPMHWGTIVGTREDAERFRELCKGTARVMEPGR